MSRGRTSTVLLQPHDSSAPLVRDTIKMLGPPGAAPRALAASQSRPSCYDTADSRARSSSVVHASVRVHSVPLVASAASAQPVTHLRISQREPNRQRKQHESHDRSGPYPSLHPVVSPVHPAMRTHPTSLVVDTSEYAFSPNIPSPARRDDAPTGGGHRRVTAPLEMLPSSPRAVSAPRLQCGAKASLSYGL